MELRYHCAKRAIKFRYGIYGFYTGRIDPYIQVAEFSLSGISYIPILTYSVSAKDFLSLDFSAARRAASSAT